VHALTAGWTTDGEVRSLGIGGAGKAVVYAKRGRLWQSITQEHLFHFH
jgi:hypothetical protein